MHIARTTVPGNGVVVYRMTNRRGQRLCVTADDVSGEHRLTAYHAHDVDVPAHEVVLDGDEVDQLAEVLLGRRVPDRLVSPRRRVDELIGELRP